MALGWFVGKGRDADSPSAFVGRVGLLAVALGVGFGLGLSPGGIRLGGPVGRRDPAVTPTPASAGQPSGNRSRKPRRSEAGAERQDPRPRVGSADLIGVLNPRLGRVGSRPRWRPPPGHRTTLTASRACRRRRPRLSPAGPGSGDGGRGTSARCGCASAGCWGGRGDARSPRAIIGSGPLAPAERAISFGALSVSRRSRTLSRIPAASAAAVTPTLSITNASVTEGNLGQQRSPSPWRCRVPRHLR